MKPEQKLVLIALFLLFISCKKEAEQQNITNPPQEAKTPVRPVITNEVERTEGMSLSDEIEQIKTMDIAHIDPATVPDGEYTGKFPFRDKYLYHVKVILRSGRIENIEVLENGTGNEYAKKGLGVIPRMIEGQSPDVEAVTGATVTSKALMKCVEKALSDGI
ncbi:FMN-binding protein [bacterium]|nr:FMN-binding protein [bacterium]